MALLLIGVGLVLAIIGLFWLKDRFENPLLARIAHSEPIMRLTVIGAAMAVIGLLLILAEIF
jgi:hypothetical protein